MQSESSNLAAWSKAVRESTLKRLRLVPAGRENWRPIPRAMSIAGIAQHIADADLWLFKKLEDPTLQAMKGCGAAQTIASHGEFLAIVSNLERTGDKRSALIRQLTPSELAQQIPDERFGGEVSVWWEIVRGNLDHETHHRGQLAAYLRIALIVTA